MSLLSEVDGAATGTKVKVVGGDGTCLKVEPLSIAAPEVGPDSAG